MKFLVRNNYLHAENESFRCAIGLNGLTMNKIEGDLSTPIGEFMFEKIFYRLDKLGSIKFLIPSSPISKDDGWCDDPSSKFYNQHVKFPFDKSAERLYREDDLYDLICVLNYNTNPIVPGKGSAIFLHICREDFAKTQGCVAIEKHNLLNLSKRIDNTTSIVIEA